MNSMNRISVIHIAFVLYFFLGPSCTSKLRKSASRRFSIVLDGQRHKTSIFVYEFEIEPDDLNDETKIYAVYNATRDVGLVTYLHDRRRYLSGLRELLDGAKMDPKFSSLIMILSHYSYIAREDLKALKETISTFLKRLEFNIYKDSVSEMLGKRKFYLWLAVNELLDRFKYEDSKTVSVLDLGTESSHVAFAPKNPSKLKPRHQTLVQDWSVFETDFYVFGESVQGLGLDEIRRQILEKNKDPHNPIRYTSVCVHPKVRANWTFHSIPYEIEGAPSKNVTTVDMKACAEVVKSVLATFEASPPLLGTEVYATSLFHTILTESGLPQNQSIKVFEIKAKAKQKCSQIDVTKPFNCMDLMFVNSMLRDIYGLKRDSEIKVVDALRGITVSWHFGAAFEVYQYDPNAVDDDD